MIRPRELLGVHRDIADNRHRIVGCNAIFGGGMSWLVLCAEIAAPVDKNSVIEVYFEILYPFSSTAAMTTSGFASVKKVNPRDTKTVLGHLH